VQELIGTCKGAVV